MESAMKMGELLPGMSRNQMQITLANRNKIRKDSQLKQYQTAISVLTQANKLWDMIYKVQEHSGNDVAMALAEKFSAFMAQDEIGGHPNPWKVFGLAMPYKKLFAEGVKTKELAEMQMGILTKVFAEASKNDADPDELISILLMQASIANKHKDVAKDFGFDMSKPLSELQAKYQTQDEKELLAIGQAEEKERRIRAIKREQPIGVRERVRKFVEDHGEEALGKEGKNIPGWKPGYKALWEDMKKSGTFTFEFEDETTGGQSKPLSELINIK
jgi:hypothetical protein